MAARAESGEIRSPFWVVLWAAFRLWRLRGIGCLVWVCSLGVSVSRLTAEETKDISQCVLIVVWSFWASADFPAVARRCQPDSRTKSGDGSGSNYSRVCLPNLWCDAWWKGGL